MKQNITLSLDKYLMGDSDSLGMQMQTRLMAVRAMTRLMAVQGMTRSMVVLGMTRL